MEITSAGGVVEVRLPGDDMVMKADIMSNADGDIVLTVPLQSKNRVARRALHHMIASGSLNHVAFHTGHHIPMDHIKDFHIIHAVMEAAGTTEMKISYDALLNAGGILESWQNPDTREIIISRIPPESPKKEEND